MLKDNGGKVIKFRTRRYRCPVCRDDRLVFYTDGTAECIDGHTWVEDEAYAK